jgi:hypothetical protein
LEQPVELFSSGLASGFLEEVIYSCSISSVALSFESQLLDKYYEGLIGPPCQWW